MTKGIWLGLFFVAAALVFFLLSGNSADVEPIQGEKERLEQKVGGSEKTGDPLPAADLNDKPSLPQGGVLDLAPKKRDRAEKVRENPRLRREEPTDLPKPPHLNHHPDFEKAKDLNADGGENFNTQGPGPMTPPPGPLPSGEPFEAEPREGMPSEPFEDTTNELTAPAYPPDGDALPIQPDADFPVELNSPPMEFDNGLGDEIPPPLEEPPDTFIAPGDELNENPFEMTPNPSDEGGEEFYE